MKNSLILILVFAVAACQSPTETNRSTNGIYKKISKEEFIQKMAEKSDFILVDCRTPQEFQQGSIPEAINIDYYDDNFEAEIGKLNKNKPVFIFCQKGGRSAKAVEKMKRQRFSEVYDLAGGFREW